MDPAARLAALEARLPAGTTLEQAVAGARLAALEAQLPPNVTLEMVVDGTTTPPATATPPAAAATPAATTAAAAPAPVTKEHSRTFLFALIVEAILAIRLPGSPHGASQDAIHRYAGDRASKSQITRALKTAEDNGRITRAMGRYKLAAADAAGKSPGLVALTLECSLVQVLDHLRCLDWRPEEEGETANKICVRDRTTVPGSRFGKFGFAFAAEQLVGELKAVYAAVTGPSASTLQFNLDGVALDDKLSLGEQGVGGGDCIDATCKQFKLHASVSDGHAMTFKVRSSISVRQLMKAIVCQTGIPRTKLRLLFYGDHLRSHFHLGHYNFEDGDTIDVLVTQRGGMYHETSGMDGVRPAGAAAVVSAPLPRRSRSRPPPPPPPPPPSQSPPPPPRRNPVAALERFWLGPRPCRLRVALELAGLQQTASLALHLDATVDDLRKKLLKECVKKGWLRDVSAVRASCLATGVLAMAGRPLLTDPCVSDTLLCDAAALDVQGNGYFNLALQLVSRNRCLELFPALAPVLATH